MGSRSSSIVIAYLVCHENISYAAALASVQGACSVARPNSGFAKQLEWYQRNGCPRLLSTTSGVHYTDLPQFRALVRRYSAEHVRALVVNAGVPDGVHVTDR